MVSPGILYSQDNEIVAVDWNEQQNGKGYYSYDSQQDL